MLTKVVHCKREPCDIYIGRARNSDNHYGNPFTHKPGTIAQIQVETREKAILAFKSWINGLDYLDLEPERRKWILNNLHKLKGKRLGCYCKPRECHGDVLAEMADKTYQL